MTSVRFWPPELVAMQAELQTTRDDRGDGPCQMRGHLVLGGVIRRGMALPGGPSISVVEHEDEDDCTWPQLVPPDAPSPDPYRLDETDLAAFAEITTRWVE